MATIEVVKVEMKSAWLSKINWTAFSSLVATAINVFGLPITPEQQVQIQVAITGLTAVITWVLKTFFTQTVNPASLTAATLDSATTVKAPK